MTDPTAPHLCPLCGTMHVPKPWPEEAGPPPWHDSYHLSQPPDPERCYPGCAHTTTTLIFRDIHWNDQ